MLIDTRIAAIRRDLDRVRTLLASAEAHYQRKKAGLPELPAEPGREHQAFLAALQDARKFPDF